MKAADFLNTIGVNTHVGSEPYNNPAQIASLLAYLGTDDIRQSSPIDDASLATMQALGKLGAKFDLIVNGGGPVNLSGALATVRQLAPYLAAVEGVNEAAIYPITYKGIGGVDAAAALQKDLYAAVKADPALSALPVYMFTLGGVDPGAFPSLGDLSAYTDFANIHSYPPHGLRPIFVIHAAIDGGRTDAPSRPVVLTETGYYTLPQNAGWGGVPDAMQANYLVSLLLDEAAAGVAKTYLYDLIDDGPDPQQVNREDHFGLFRNDGSAKPAADAIHALTTLLADPGTGSTTPLPFGFTATGVPYDYTGNTLLLDKTDGTHVIAVWNEQQVWDPDTQTASEPRHFPTTVRLDKAYATVLVYEPTLGTAPTRTLHDVSSLDLDLTDHPFLIVVPPPAPPVGPIGTAPTPVPAPGDVVVLRIAEDAYRGDAQFVVRVDGAQVGGTQTSLASHNAGQAQDFTIRGLPTGQPHRVEIQFLNDAYTPSGAGGAGGDRNLHIEAVSLNGATQPAAAATLYAPGTRSVVTPGPDTTIVFNVSEDAYQGDARARLNVDGQDVGDVVTITAAHAMGQHQSMRFIGPLSAGPHQLGLTFLNDRWDGGRLDRNAYLESVDIGARHVEPRLTLYSQGTRTFTLPGLAPALGAEPVTIDRSAILFARG